MGAWPNGKLLAMSSPTAQLSLLIQQGATFAPRWRHGAYPYAVKAGPGGTLLTAATGRPAPPADFQPTDFTGCTARMQLRRAVLDDQVLLEFSTAPAAGQGGIVLSADGWVQVQLDALQTAALSFGDDGQAGQWRRAVGQMEVTFADGTVQRMFEIQFELSPEGTR